MNGVAYVTQCPTRPGQSFPYKFKAYHRGTLWYHSHVRVQRTIGVLGPFIIPDKKEHEMKDIILTLQEWNHDMDSTTEFISNEEGIYIDGVKHRRSKTLDDGKFGLVNF